jgi:hypothetical protein
MKGLRRLQSGSILVQPKSFAISGGISGHNSPHLIATCGRAVPQLDSLSVRCLSSYLFFAHILVTSTRAGSPWRAGLLLVRRLSSSP